MIQNQAMSEPASAGKARRKYRRPINRGASFSVRGAEAASTKPLKAKKTATEKWPFHSTASGVSETEKPVRPQERKGPGVKA